MHKTSLRNYKEAPVGWRKQKIFSNPWEAEVKCRENAAWIWALTGVCLARFVNAKYILSQTVSVKKNCRKDHQKKWLATQSSPPRNVTKFFDLWFSTFAPDYCRVLGALGNFQWNFEGYPAFFYFYVVLHVPPSVHVFRNPPERPWKNVYWEIFPKTTQKKYRDLMECTGIFFRQGTFFSKNLKEA